MRTRLNFPGMSSLASSKISYVSDCPKIFKFGGTTLSQERRVVVKERDEGRVFPKISPGLPAG